MAIGIDRYHAWDRLDNAVNDATGTIAAFEKLGFKQLRAPLLDGAATGQAIRDLTTDELSKLGTTDSLVLFFSGHGHTITNQFPDGDRTKNGYLIPVDAELPSGRIGTWLSLKNWLSEIATLPAKHILVILDACHSGVALDPVIRWRGADVRTSEAHDRLRMRRSRRIITSAHDDQLALDSGPLHGHSLFTGCLIEALTGGIPMRPGQSAITGSELGVHVQNRVTNYPSSKQTPDFGALELDNRGELIFDLATPTPPPPSPSPSSERITGPHQIPPKNRAKTDPSPSLLVARPAIGPDSIRSRRAQPTTAAAQDTVQAIRVEDTQPVASPAPVTPSIEATTTTSTSKTASDGEATSTEPVIAPVVDVISKPAVQVPEIKSLLHGPNTPGPIPNPPTRITQPAPDAAFVGKLDLHHTARTRSPVLSVVTADPLTSLTGWATWSAKRGWLTLVTEGNGLDEAIADLLNQIPWLRALPGARARLAATAHTDVQSIDAALDKRSTSEREAWIEDISGRDAHAHVSGWLLSAFRAQWATVPDLATAPVQGVELLSILGALGTPISILIHHTSPTPEWLARAIQTASELIAYLPRLPIAIGTPDELVKRVLRESPQSKALALARHGLVPVSARLPRPAGEPRTSTNALHEAIAGSPALASLFTPNVPVPTHDRERAVTVDLFARDALLAVQIDDWYHVRDSKSYHRDRIKDVWLQRAGFFVMRFLAEDVEDRLERVVEEIALGVGARRAAGPLAEKLP